MPLHRSFVADVYRNRKTRPWLLLSKRSRALFGLALLLSLIRCSNGQTLRRPKTCSLEEINPQVVRCEKVFGSPQTCQLFLGTSSSSPNEAAAAGDSDANTEVYFEALRNCDCGSLPYTDYYCPMVANSCHVPRWRSYQPNPRAPICLNQDSGHQQFTKSIWPVLVVTMGCISACFVCSRSGHQALSCIGSTLAPFSQKVYATYLLRRRPEQASFLVRRWVRRREERLRERYNEIISGVAEPSTNVSTVEEDLLHNAIAHSRQGRPHMLKLPTRIFREKEREALQNTNMMISSPSSEDKGDTKTHDPTEDLDNDDDLDVDFDGCMICFGPLCDGDRVGALRCCHVFHAKCLKTWLRRRNVCPLCLCEDAAEAVKHESTDPSRST